MLSYQLTKKLKLLDREPTIPIELIQAKALTKIGSIWKIKISKFKEQVLQINW